MIVIVIIASCINIVLVRGTKGFLFKNLYSNLILYADKIILPKVYITAKNNDANKDNNKKNWKSNEESKPSRQ